MLRLVCIIWFFAIHDWVVNKITQGYRNVWTFYNLSFRFKINNFLLIISPDCFILKTNHIIYCSNLSKNKTREIKYGNNFKICNNWKSEHFQYRNKLFFFLFFTWHHQTKIEKKMSSNFQETSLFVIVRLLPITKTFTPDSFQIITIMMIIQISI